MIWARESVGLERLIVSRLEGRAFEADLKVGTLLALVGPSGCGKTALLCAIAARAHGDFMSDSVLTLGEQGASAAKHGSRIIWRLDRRVIKNITTWADAGAGGGSLMVAGIRRPGFADAFARLAGRPARFFAHEREGWRWGVTLENKDGAMTEYWPSVRLPDGLALAAALIAVALVAPSPILIETPEAGLHPETVSRMASVLRDVARSRSAQIIFSCCHPYALDGLAPEEAAFITADGRARSFSSVRLIDERMEDYGLGELWTAYGEDKLAKLCQEAKE